MKLAASTWKLHPGVRVEIKAPAAAADDLAPRFVSAFYLQAGASVTFRVKPRGPETRYSWQLNGRAITGALGPILPLENVGSTAAGTYSVAIDDSGESAVTDVATLTVVSDARITHFSLSSEVTGPQQNLAMGFFVAGAGAKRVLLRSEGFVGGDWVLAGWSGQELARGRIEHGSEELNATLELGGYSASVANRPRVERVVPNALGKARVQASNAVRAGALKLELHEAASEGSATAFANVSGRAYVGTGAAGLIAAFTIAGAASATVLLRGIGPSLRSLFGMPDALERTQLVLRDATGREIGANCGWGGSTMLAEVFAQAGAFALPGASGDSALLVTLPAGEYVAEFSSSNGATGQGLVEVYLLPAK